MSSLKQWANVAHKKKMLHSLSVQMTKHMHSLSVQKKEISASEYKALSKINK